MKSRAVDWKLVLVPREGDTKEAVSAAYQLRDDPSESKDLAAEDPERVANLSASLKALHSEIMAAPILPISR